MPQTKANIYYKLSHTHTTQRNHSNISRNTAMLHDASIIYALKGAYRRKSEAISSFRLCTTASPSIISRLNNLIKYALYYKIGSTFYLPNVEQTGN